MDCGCRLILVRHAETEWNRTRRIQGHEDVALTPLGREQARLVALRLAATERVSAVYSSDLSRALQTAQAVAEPFKLAVRQDPSLRERNYGVWEGLTWEEIEERHPELVARRREDPLRFAVPGGESIETLTARVWGALLRISALHAGQTVVVVSHGGAIRSAVHQALGLDPSVRARLRVDNGSLTVLHLGANSEPQLVTLNDVCHLDGSFESPDGRLHRSS